MSLHLSSEHTAKVVPQIDPVVQLFDEGVAIEVASSLRERSRELRASSETLRTKNREVMKRADAVAVRYYDLVFGE